MTADAFAQQAFYFLERRRLSDARRVLHSGLLQFPQDPDLLFHSAQLEWLGDNHEQADKVVRQVLVVDPHHAPARELLASVLIENGDLADAEMLLIDLLRDYPEAAHLYGRYSQLMLKTLHLEKAEKLAQEGLRYDPDDHDCLMAHALCETARSGSRPNAALQKLLVTHPQSLSAVHALVVALVDSGRVDEAHNIAREAMRADPANEHLVTLVRELRVHNHWTMLPLYPLTKWGWTASAIMWVGGILIAQMLPKVAPQATEPFVYTWLGYCIYSWVWPPLLRKIL